MVGGEGCCEGCGEGFERCEWLVVKGVVRGVVKDVVSVVWDVGCGMCGDEYGWNVD